MQRMQDLHGGQAQRGFWILGHGRVAFLLMISGMHNKTVMLPETQLSAIGSVSHDEQDA